MADAQGSHWLESFWGVVKAIAYELRPFTLPNRGDLKRTAKKMQINAQQLWAEGGRLMPEIVEAAKGVNPLRALKIVAWLIGWAVFTWIEFGEEIGERVGTKSCRQTLTLYQKLREGHDHTGLQLLWYSTSIFDWVFD